MEFFDSILLGFQVILQPTISSSVYRRAVGTLVGVLPGIGPVGAYPFFFRLPSKAPPLEPHHAGRRVLWSTIRGSTTSILVNIPGESSSVVTCIDGYQMARKGRAGPALAIAAWGSFIAGTLSVVGLMLISKPLANAALSFGPPEYFALMCAG